MVFMGSTYAEVRPQPCGWPLLEIGLVPLLKIKPVPLLERGLVPFLERGLVPLLERGLMPLLERGLAIHLTLVGSGHDFSSTEGR